MAPATTLQRHTRERPQDVFLRRTLDVALTDVRARIRGHAGDVVIDTVDDGRVTLEFLGACRGCPAQAFTFYAAVEPALAKIDGVTHIEPPRTAAPPSVIERIRGMTRSTVTEQAARSSVLR